MIQSVFFTLFTHFSVGLLFTILFIPIQEIGKLFFRVTTGVAFALIFLAMLSRPFGSISLTDLLAPGANLTQKLTYLFFYLSLILLAVYNFLLPRFHKPLLWASFLTGLMGVVFFSLSIQKKLAAHMNVGGLLSTGNALASTLILGSVLAAMITGHWYLVQHKLSLEPLKRATRVYVFSVILRIAGVIAACIVSLEAIRASGMFASFDFRSQVFTVRVVIGLLLPLIFGWMIWNSAQIRSTQSATGILYATIVLVLIGEAFSNFLYLLTGIPF